MTCFKRSLFIILSITALVSMNIACDRKAPQSNIQNSNVLQMALDAVAKDKSPENYLNLSLRYYEAGQWEKSLEAAKESAKIKPDYAFAYNNICAAYNQMKSWDKAIEACSRAIELDNGFQLAKNNLSAALNGKKAMK